MRLFNGTDLALYFFFYAFAAWVLETLIFSLRRQRFVNCGILDLPLLLSHGTAMVILIIVSSGDIPYHSQAVFALVMTLTIGYLGEGIAERVLRKKRAALGKLRLRPNFKWRFLWAVLLAAVYESLVIVVQPLLFSLISLLPPLIVHITALVLSGLLFVDLLLVSVLARHLPTSAERQFLRQHKKKLGERLSEQLWERVYRSYPSLRQSEGSGIEAAEQELKAQGIVFARGIHFEKLVWMLFLCAIIGDGIETLYVFFTAGVWMRRSSLVLGPFSIVWGLGAVVLTLVLSRIERQNVFSIFLTGFFFGGAFEYLCSVFTEAFFGMKFWDYSRIPLNIDGRTNVPFMCFWGLLAVLWLHFAYPPLSARIEQINPILGLVLGWGIAVFLCCDMAVTVAVMVRAHARMAKPKAENVIEAFIDRYYPDDRIRRLWPNMKFLNS